ncbi:MAG: chloride channel protein [Comamonadaceae bacterium]|nr:chloride channel protein [Comamonadaceae bacterium]
MRPHPHVTTAIMNELKDGHLWQGRAIFIGFAALSGLSVVALTWLAEHALALFFSLQQRYGWAPLLWTPLMTAAIVWVTRRYFAGAAGSGIPQVMAAQHESVPLQSRHVFVSFKLSMAKVALTTCGLLAGLSLGREGPSVQIAAGVMHSARRWLPKRSQISDYSLLTAGGAAGIAAAFNTPLGGIMFAIEELSRKPEQRNHSLTVAAIVLAGLMGVSMYGNKSHFGVIRIEGFGWSVLLPALLVALCCGVLGGLFSRLLVVSLAGQSTDWFSRQRHQHPVLFAGACGLVVAVIGVVTLGATFGSGYAHTKAALDNTGDTSGLYVLLKFVATWLTTWAGVPAGIFAPSLAIGGALGGDIAQLTGYVNAPTLIALGMVAFLAAVTQAPLTAFIIVMEMVDGHALVLSLMTSALLASGVSRLISTPLYSALADLQLRRLPKP